MNGNAYHGRRTVVGALAVGMVVLGLSLQGAPAGGDATILVNGSDVKVAVGRAPAGDEGLRRARVKSATPVGGGAARTDIACANPNVQEGDPCSCDDECCGLNSAGGCVRGQCLRTCVDSPTTTCANDADCSTGVCGAGTCSAEDADLEARCEADGDFCTLDRCEFVGNPGVLTCVTQDDGAGGNLSPCAKHCVGGTEAGLYCSSATDCPLGSCQPKSFENGMDVCCNETDDHCYLITWWGDCPGDPATGDGRCCVDDTCDLTTEANCAGTWLRIPDPSDLDHCICPQYGSGIAPDTGDGVADVHPVVASWYSCNIGKNRCQNAGSADCYDRCVGGTREGNVCDTATPCPGPSCECNYYECSPDGGQTFTGVECNPDFPGWCDDGQTCELKDTGTCTQDTCVANADACAGGFLNLGDDYVVANGSYLRLKEFRFRGGVENQGETIVFEFWDNNPALAAPVYADAFSLQLDQAGIFDYVIEVDCWPDCEFFQDEQEEQQPYIIPPRGYVVMRSRRAEDAVTEANAHWMSTDAVDVGANDPNILWYWNAASGGPVQGDYAGLDIDILMFELVGERIPDPLGACCLEDPCQDTTRWNCGLCALTGDRCAQSRDCGLMAGESVSCRFQNWFGPWLHDQIVNDETERCAAGPCDVAACCVGGACTVEEMAYCTDTLGGTPLAPGTQCEPNCCPQNDTGADCTCETWLCRDYSRTVCSKTGIACATSADCDPDDPEGCIEKWTRRRCATAADCMTCSMATTRHCTEDADCPSRCNGGDNDGFVCVPRCDGGTFNGKVCNDASDCPGSPGGCDGDYDCPGGFCDNTAETCESVQPCEHRCDGPTFATVTMPFQCEDIYGPFYPPIRCDRLNGDADCTAIDPTWTCTALLYIEADGTTATNTYTFEGDNSVATIYRASGDLCSLAGSGDPGWYEGFELVNPSGDPANDCALVTIDFCCAEPAKIPVHEVLRRECPDCRWQSPDIIPVLAQPAAGYGPDSLAEYYCEDGNYTATFTLAPGKYTWQIYGSPVCEGTTDPCTQIGSDDDCDPGVQCIETVGPYTGHWTAQVCWPAACCVKNQCTLLNRLACENAGLCAGGGGDDGAICLQDSDCDSGFCDPVGGHFLGDFPQPIFDCEMCDPIEDCTGSWGGPETCVCCTGACCVGPGDCSPIYTTLAECEPDNGVYIGGVSCYEQPCPICLFGDLDHGHNIGDLGSIIVSDRFTGASVADDFLAGPDTPIANLCWTPAFYKPGQPECSDPGGPPDDKWRARFYEDDGTGVPGAVIGPLNGQEITVDAKMHLGPNSRAWDYAGSLPTPVDVVEGDCYWIEITGMGNATCGTWLVTTSEGAPGNHHSMYDIADMGNYTASDAAEYDFVWHIDAGVQGVDDCGEYYGVCCLCPDTCEGATTQADCYDRQGTWIMDANCGADPCPGVPSNDGCNNATPVSGDQVCIGGGNDGNPCTSNTECPGGECGYIAVLDFQNICATDDGPDSGCAGGDFHFDIWYRYAAPVCGLLTVSTCNEAPFDTILAMYDPNIACDQLGPSDQLDRCNNVANCCGEDTCGISAGPSELSLDVVRGEEVLVRLGGWYDMAEGQGYPKGFGRISFQITNICPPGPPAPEPGGPQCTTDDDCTAAGDRWLGALCVAGTCYVPKNRYLSIDPTTNAEAVAFQVTVTEASQKICSVTRTEKCQVDGDCPMGETCEYKYDQTIIGTTWWLEDPVCKDYKGETCPANSAGPHPDPCQVPDSIEIVDCSAIDENGNEWMFGWYSSLGSKNGPAPPKRVWTETPLHVGDCIIAPVITYEIAGSEMDGGSIGPALEIGTIRQPDKDWGDITGGAIPGPPPKHWSPPNGITNATDISAVVAAFEQWDTGYAPVCRADLTGDQNGDFNDIQAAVRAFEQDAAPTYVEEVAFPVPPCP